MLHAPDHLFVYGTLRPPFENPFARHLRQLGRYVGEGSFPGQLYDLGHYPGAIYLINHATNVYGSIYDISTHWQEVLTLLDDYEGISELPNQSDEYIRIVVPVTGNGRLLDCWVYVYNRNPAASQLIESGDYVHYSRNE